MLVRMIEQNPEFKMYKYGDYMPDIYDELFKVWQGIVTEDFDTFVAENFLEEE